MSKENHTGNFLQDAGFSLWGITTPDLSPEDRSNLESFIEQGFYGSMDWFPDRQNIRMDFENLGFPVRSILMLGAIYKPTPESESMMKDTGHKVARYAYGEDYHLVLKDRAKPIMEHLRSQFPGKKFRQGVDSLPIPEKILARNAGLGWIGKNTLLIHSEVGSYFFLSAILCEVEPDELDRLFRVLAENSSYDWNIPKLAHDDLPSHIEKDRCGSCRACIDACPTQAIVEPYKLDAGKCISHHTIEYRGEFFPPGMKTHGWTFGCDICQEVCPWNRVKAERRGVATTIPEFTPLPVWKKTPLELQKLSEEEFHREFQNSPVHRTGRKLLLRNLKSILAK